MAARIDKQILEALTMDAEKQKASKVPVWLHLKFFPRALKEVAKVMDFGAGKPGRKPGGWTEQSSVRDDYFKDALIRHLMDMETDGAKDSESGLLHKAHVACNALMDLEMELRKQESEEYDNAVLSPGTLAPKLGDIKLYSDAAIGPSDVFVASPSTVARLRDAIQPFGSS
jgi:hypothetical protein